ncbi:MAG TPA: hypothetical protein VHG72_05690 [Polyangia bacterium]|nr:hypothetical protein [Polyangia bacterium]
MPATAYDLEDMDPFFRDLGDLQAKFMSLEHDLRTFLFLHSGRPFMQDMESVASATASRRTSSRTTTPSAS